MTGGLPNLLRDRRAGRKVFFSEEKKQKTFLPSGVGSAWKVRDSINGPDFPPDTLLSVHYPASGHGPCDSQRQTGRLPKDVTALLGGLHRRNTVISDIM
jgi:hypothetical protein